MLNDKVGKCARFVKSMQEALDLTKKNDVEYSQQYKKIISSTSDNTTIYLPLLLTKGEKAKAPVPKINGKIAGTVHTHSKGDGPIFSYGDFQMLAFLTVDYDIENLDEFFYGVITIDGNNTYMLMIEDKDAFIKWRDNYFIKATTDWLKRQNQLFLDDYVEDKSNYETNFIRYLKERKTGLRLYKGNTNDFSTWIKK